MSDKSATRRVNIYINGKEVKNSMTAIEREFYKARSAVRKATKGTEEYQNQLKRMRDAKKHLEEHRRQLNGISRSWQQFRGILAGVLGANLIQGGLATLNNFVRRLITKNAQLSDSYADVMKFTGLTRTETEELAKEFDAFNTRTPRKELLGLAQVAGRIGIEGKNNIKAFVEQANQINVALGEDLGEEAVLQIGKISAAFEADMLKIGSAINSVGQSSRAKEGYLVEFASRMQGTAVTTGIAASEIIGFGAVLDSFNQKVEMSGTALNTFFIEFTKDTEKFGKAAGFAEGELSKLVGEEGTNAGFIAFLEKMKEANPTAKEMTQALDEVGITGTRGSQVFLTLANNLKEVREMQEISNQAFEEGTSITEEYNIRNENLAANLAKVERWLHKMFVNSAILKGAEKLVKMFSDWIEIPLSENIQKDITKLNVLELQIYDTNTSTEDRLKLIRELKSEYPQYLKDIDAETVSNQELNAALEKVNRMLVAKLAIQKRQEQIDEVNEEAAERLLELDDQRMKMYEKLVKYAEANDLTLLGADGQGSYTLYEQINDLQEKMIATNDRYAISQSNYLKSLAVEAKSMQEEINELNQEALSLTQEKNRLANELGLNDKEVEKNNEPTERQEKELETLKQQFEQKRALLKELEAQARIEDEADEALRREEQFERMRLNAMSERDIELELMQAKYEMMQEASKDNATALIAIEAWKASEIERINDEFRDEELAADLDLKEKQYNETIARLRDTETIVRASGNFLLGMMDMLGEQAENSASFNKARALFQIGINLAEGLVAAGLAGTKDKYNSVTAGGSGLATFATLSGLMMSTVANARQLVSKNNAPRYQRARRGFFVGGYTGDGSIYDEAGAVHKGEYVNPNWMVSSPALAPVFEAMESIRSAGPSFLQASRQPQVAFGGFNSSSAKSGFASSNNGMSEEAIGAAVGKYMAPYFEKLSTGEIRVTADFKLSQLREAERDLDRAKTLSGLKRN